MVRVCVGVDWSANPLERLLEVAQLVLGVAQTFDDVGIPIEFLPTAAFDVAATILSFAFSFILPDDDSIPPDKGTVASCIKRKARLICKLSVMFIH